MKEISEHRKILRKASDYAFSYGIENTDIDFKKYKQRSDVPKSLIKEFTKNCHEGFKLAQKIIINEIIYYQEVSEKLKSDLKKARRNQEQKTEESIITKEKIVKHRLSTFSHVADGIAWQMIGGEIHVARRFFLDPLTNTTLKHSNIEHAIEVSDKINENPEYFALISDLTNFIQIGDLLVKTSRGNQIVELKKGKVNSEILKFIDSLNKEGKTLQDVDLKDHFDQKTIKQIKRMDRQKNRMKGAFDIITTDQGIDPVSKTQMRLLDPKVPTVYYHNVLSDLHLQLEKKNWAYTILEGCLHIGMYKDEAIQMSPFIIEQLLKEKTENYLIIDWMSIVNNVSEPIFAKPFKPEFIIDVLTGHVKVIMGLNFEEMVRLFNAIGLETRWLTEKETMKLKQKKVRDGLVEINKRAIAVKPKNMEEFQLYGGVISKILYDNITPSNIAETFLTLDPST